MTVLAADRWKSNAELIRDVADLGLIDGTMTTLDPTYGKGVWWKLFRPVSLVAHDVKLDGVDFRDLPHADRSFQLVGYDPPYVSVGGRKTTTMPEFHQRFGMDKAPTSPGTLQADLINPGLDEVYRVLCRRGRALVKCQDYISSGKLWLGRHWTLTHAIDVGFKVIDIFEHIGNARPQPSTNPDGSERRQVHARRNLSTLFVLEK